MLQLQQMLCRTDMEVLELRLKEHKNNNKLFDVQIKSLTPVKLFSIFVE